MDELRLKEQTGVPPAEVGPEHELVELTSIRIDQSGFLGVGIEARTGREVSRPPVETA